MAPSHEDEWKLMIDQDPHLRSIAGDSGHGTMTVTEETESTEDVEKLTGAVGEVNESASAEYLSDVKWRDDDPLFVFNNDNVTKPQTPPLPQPQFGHVKEKIQLPQNPNHPLGKSLTSENPLMTDCRKQSHVISNLIMMKGN